MKTFLGISGTTWTAIGTLATIVGVIVASNPRSNRPAEPIVPQISSDDDDAPPPQETSIIASNSLNKEFTASQSELPSHTVNCAAAAALEPQSAEKVRVDVGACWKPCDNVTLVVEEVFLDTNGKASDKIIIDWSGRQIKKISYQVNASLQLSESCQIHIDDTGDTLYSQYVEFALSANPISIKMY